MNNERQFKGIWIPKEVWLSENLNLQEKVVLVEIDSLETEERGCYASNKYFSDFFKLSAQRISQIIQELSNKGYIKIGYIKENNAIVERQLRICRPPYPEVSNIFDRGIKYSLGGYQENFKENNIYMNNIYNNINTTTEIYDYISNNYNRMLSASEIEKIQLWLSEYNEDMIKKAIDISCLQNVKTFAYAEGILKNWKGKGYKTIGDLQNEEKMYNNEPKKTKTGGFQL